MLTADKLKELKAGDKVLDTHGQEWDVVGEWPIVGASLGWRYRTLDEHAPFRLK